MCFYEITRRLQASVQCTICPVVQCIWSCAAPYHERMIPLMQRHRVRVKTIKQKVSLKRWQSVLNMPMHTEWATAADLLKLVGRGRLSGGWPKRKRSAMAPTGCNLDCSSRLCCNFQVTRSTCSLKREPCFCPCTAPHSHIFAYA